MKIAKNLGTWCRLALLAAALVGGNVTTGQDSPPPAAEDTETNQPDSAESESMQPAEEPEAQPVEESQSERRDRRYRRPAIVEFGTDAELGTNDSTEAMVIIGGSATVRGKVQNAVVAIGGDITLQEGAEVSQAVAVLGGIKAEKGSRIRGEAVSVGGRIEVQEGAEIEGQMQEVPMPALFLPKPLWLREWFRHCVLALRPLAPQVGWVWGVAGAWFLFYVLVAAAFPRPVRTCVEELQRRPATTFALGILVLILTPLVFLLLTFTGVGLLVIPFIMAALVLAAIVGKVGFLEWLGLSIGRPFRASALENPLVALLVGSILLALLYMVPLLGLLLLLVTGVWGLGASVGAAFGGMRRELPPRDAAPAPQPAYAMGAGAYGAPYGEVAPAFAPAGGGTSVGPAGEPQVSGMGSPGTATSASTAAAPLPPGFAPPVLPEVLAYPRAGFWERIGAGFLDMVLVIILGSIVGSFPLTLMIALAYFAGMWGWRATTIGGIVLGLKVVRTDGSPVTFAVAIVRGLAAAFSIVVLFLGFLWIAWDKERQGWHDQIAGTVIIKLPRGTPLICF